MYEQQQEKIAPHGLCEHDVMSLTINEYLSEKKACKSTHWERDMHILYRLKWTQDEFLWKILPSISENLPATDTVLNPKVQIKFVLTHRTTHSRVHSKI